MRFFTDESCDLAVVRALRAAGHDVMARSACPRASLRPLDAYCRFLGGDTDRT